MLAYGFLTALNIVFLGEHYALDVAGAIVLAGGVAVVTMACERAPWRRLAASNPIRQPRFGAAESGQNLLEFAMLTPFVIGFIAILVTLGLALNARSSLQQGVREGARQAAVGASPTEVVKAVVGNAPDEITVANVAICYPMNGSSQGKVGDPVQVSITGKEYTLVSTGGILNAIPGPLKISPLKVTLDPKATARLEKSVASPNSC